MLRELHTAIPSGWFGVNREEPDDDPVAICRELSAASYHPDHRIVLDRPEPGRRPACGGHLGGRLDRR